MLSEIPTPDNWKWPEDVLPTECTLEDGAVWVQWTSGGRSRFHPLWLRDNCACPACVHVVTRESRNDLRDIPPDVAVETASLRADGGLVVTWKDDDHVSVYHPGWLFAHSDPTRVADREQTLWRSDDLREPPEIKSQSGRVSDHSLYQALLAVQRYGIVRLSGLSREPGLIETIALRIGPLRETHFDRVFDVVSRSDADSNAYTSDELPAHTDIPTRETPPGLQLLHSLVADATGGDSTMTDGYRVAEDMRKQYPNEFRNITTTDWEYANRAGDKDYRWKSPHVVLNKSGRIDEVRLLPFSRAPLVVDYDAIEPAYRALRKFIEMVNSSEYQSSYRMSHGDLVIFDNRRVLHGRTAFDPSTGNRALQGVYLDRDDLYAAIRQLGRQLGACDSTGKT